MNWKSFTLSFIWFLICAAMITMFSYVDKEWFIDGREIKNICEVMQALVVDDTRDIGGSLTFLMIVPLIYYSFHKKHRAWHLYLMTVLLIAFWVWRFYLRFQLCW